MIKTFDDSKYATKIFITTKDNEQKMYALKYILASPSVSYDVLKNSYYFNEEEKQLLINSALRSSNCASNILINYPKILNKEQIDKAFNYAIGEFSSTYSLLLNNYGNPKQRKQMISLLLLSNYYTIQMLEHCKNITVEESLYIIEEIKDIKELIKKYLTYHKTQNECREIAFSYILDDKRICLNLAYSNDLNNIEKQAVHDKYGVEKVKEIRRSFNEYVHYCKIFSQCLTYEEQEILMYKLTKSSRKSYIQQCLDNIKFCEEISDRLKSYILAYRMMND